MSRHLAAIVATECLILARTARITLVVGAVVGLLQQFAVISAHTRSIAHEQSELLVALSQSAVLVSLILIPLMGQILLSKSLLAERARGVLVSVLTTSVAPGTVWLGKVIAAFIVCYAIVLVVLATSGVATTVVVGAHAFSDPVVAATALVTAPLTAAGLLALVSYLYWLLPSAASVTAVAIMGVAVGLSRIGAGDMDAVTLMCRLIALAALGAVASIVLLTHAMNRRDRGAIAGVRG